MIDTVMFVYTMFLLRQDVALIRKTMPIY